MLPREEEILLLSTSLRSLIVCGNKLLHYIVCCVWYFGVF